MENASKALIMAAEVLIAMVILSLAMYLVITFGNFSQQVHEQNEEIELTQFNSQFAQFEAMENVTIYDIVTVANYARENNQRYELDASSRDKESTYYISVYRKLSSSNNAIEHESQPELDKLIKQDIKEMRTRTTNYLPKYRCQTFTSATTGRIYKVIFSR